MATKQLRMAARLRVKSYEELFFVHMLKDIYSLTGSYLNSKVSHQGISKILHFSIRAGVVSGEGKPYRRR